ncbi:hypothetical protein ACIBCR_15280 [Micromonospora echinospora]|uniref:hypothetical protein n=1 Tax=Micromonospora echinospora TaxID=1877 RepID=UPI00379A5E9F
MTTINPADYTNADPTTDPTTWTIKKMRAAITHLNGKPVNLTRKGFKQQPPITESQVRLVGAYLYMNNERVTMEWERDDEAHRDSVRLNEIVSIEVNG